MRKDLISRSALLKKAIGVSEFDDGWERVLRAVPVLDIEMAEAVDVVPAVHGRWIGIEYDGYADGCPVYDVWQCSECGFEHNGEDDTLTNYCPNCGARMDEEE